MSKKGRSAEGARKRSTGGGRNGGAWVSTFRLPGRTRDFVREEAVQRGRSRVGRPMSISACVGELIVDLRDHYELPSPGPQHLEAERKTLGLSRREYARFVFSERVRLLQRAKS